MRFDVEEKKKDPQFPFTGRQILGLMQDKETSKVDLLVREVIQNSADAIAPGKEFGKIWIKLNDFAVSPLLNTLGDFGVGLKNRLPTNRENAKCLVLFDGNTVGLCGCPYENKKIKKNNLFNLVYNVLGANKEFDAGSGGSHGIGKTVYFHYGKGLVFFYSHTKEEDGTVHHKLSGLYLEDTNNQQHLLSDDSSGIVLFGKDGFYNGKPISEPITDEEAIKEFLGILGFSPYSDSAFGTTVLIPFVTPEQFAIKGEEDFKEELYDMLRWSVQRWYFPRINNKEFPRPYIKCMIGGSDLELNPLFQKLQCLYNVDIWSIKELHEYDVDVFGDGNYQGFFYYKVFKKEELGVGIPPENYPGAFEQIFGPGQKDENVPVFAYMRNPGMVITYDFNDKIHLQTNLKEDEYLFGFFIVNPDCIDAKGKTLDDYFKKSERDNHKQWSDLKDDEDFDFSKKRVFKKICTSIKKYLQKEFSDETQKVETDNTSGRLKRIISKALLPPDDFGTKPSKPPKRTPPRKGIRKPHAISTSFLGFTSDQSYPTYSITIPFSKEATTKSVSLCVKTEHKKVGYSAWEDYGFKLPFKIQGIIFSQYCFDYPSKLYNPNQTLDLKQPEIELQNADYGVFASVQIITSRKEGYPSEIRISKTESTQGFTLVFKVLVEPINLDYQIGFECN